MLGPNEWVRFTLACLSPEERADVDERTWRPPAPTLKTSVPLLQFNNLSKEMTSWCLDQCSQTLFTFLEAHKRPGWIVITAVCGYRRWSSINAQIARVNSMNLLKKSQLFMFYLKKYILHMLAAWYLESFGRSTVAGTAPRSCMDYPYLHAHVLSMISFPELPLGRPGSKSHILLLWERIVFKVWTFYSNTPAWKREEREKPSASRMILSPESTMCG